jgi:MT0933-like antitoxin protein
VAKFNLTKLTSKAKELVDKNGDKIASSVDKVTTKIDEKTKGKYHDKLEKVDSAAAKLDKTEKPDSGVPTTASAAADDGQPVDPTDAVAAAEETLPPAAGQPSSFPEPS